MRDDQINRLMRSAAHADDLPDEAMPFGFETRVIAQWKSRAEEVSFALFRRALAFACAAVLASFALSYHTLKSSPSTELALADNAMETSFAP